jgi:hypothetical protein
MVVSVGLGLVSGIFALFHLNGFCACKLSASSGRRHKNNIPRVSYYIQLKPTIIFIPKRYEYPAADQSPVEEL